MRHCLSVKALLHLMLGLFLCVLACKPEEPEFVKGGVADSSSVPPTVSYALPSTAFSLAWINPALPNTVPSGTSVPVTVQVKNTGDQVWLDSKSLRTDPPGAGAVRLGVRWWKEGDPEPGPNSDYAALRVELTKPLRPGEIESFSFSLEAPPKEGEYMLQVDLVQELVSWFHAAGAAPLIRSVNVKNSG